MKSGTKLSIKVEPERPVVKVITKGSRLITTIPMRTFTPL
jgi:hypothetical protein